jgi:preprotein translocase subunit SecE
MLSVFNIGKFLREVYSEYKKVVFPTKDDTIKTSIWIGVVVFVTSCLIWLTDFLISIIIRAIFGLN